MATTSVGIIEPTETTTSILDEAILVAMKAVSSAVTTHLHRATVCGCRGCKAQAAQAAEWAANLLEAA